MKPETLMNFGLTKNESIVYLSLLRIGNCKVSKLIKEAKFKSGKIYEVLDSLANKGLVSHSIKNNVKHYSAQDPKKIQDYINLQKQKLEDEEENFLKQLPALNKINSSEKESCDIKTYEDVEGIRSALFYFLDQLENNSTIFIHGANDNPNRDILLSWARYDDICKKKNIKTKVIMTSISKEGIEQRKTKKNKSYKYLEGTDLSNFMICKNITILFNFDQPNCILIENSAYTSQFKELFNILWNTAKKI